MEIESGQTSSFLCFFSSKAEHNLLVDTRTLEDKSKTRGKTLQDDGCLWSQVSSLFVFPTVDL